MNDLTCPCNCCKEKPKKSDPRFYLRTPPKKRKSPAKIFFWTLGFSAALFALGYYFWT